MAQNPSSSAATPRVMAYHQQNFSSQLAHQLNQKSNQVIHLQYLLAQKDDQLSTLSTQLRGALTAASLNGRPSQAVNIKALRTHNDELQGQLRQAKENISSLRSGLSASHEAFNAHWQEQQQKMEALNTELTKTREELQRVKAVKATPQKQDKAASYAKKSCEKLQCTMSTGLGMRQLYDEDDEEPIISFIKQEPEPATVQSTRPHATTSSTAATTPKAAAVEWPLRTKVPKHAKFSEPVPTKQEVVLAAELEPTDHTAKQKMENDTERGETIPKVTAQALQLIGNNALDSPALNKHVATQQKESATAPAGIMPTATAQDLQPTSKTTIDSPANNDHLARKLSSRPSSIASTSSRRQRLQPTAASALPQPPQAKAKKRHRSSHKERLEAELRDLAPFEDYKLMSPPTKRAKLSGNDKQDCHAKLKEDFHFKAIVSYTPDGSIDEWYDSRLDLHDCLEELWDLIASQPEVRRTQEWVKNPFVPNSVRKYSHEGASECVWCYIGNTKTSWGRERARWACERCVKQNRPCFAPVDGEWRLLPLHESDRNFEVEKDCEIRTWVNVE